MKKQLKRLRCVGATGIEPVTSSMSRKRSPAELSARVFVAIILWSLRSKVPRNPKGSRSPAELSARVFVAIILWSLRSKVSRNPKVSHRPTRVPQASSHRSTVRILEGPFS